MKEKILSLLNDIENLKSKNKAEIALPENVFYLNDTDVVCMERFIGESRYPYYMDGLTLWAHSTGHIAANESNFVIFRTAALGEGATLDFWGGISNGDEWIPVSVTGATKPLYEPVSVSRYTVYSPRCAYYIADTEKVIFALRVAVTTSKQLSFTATAINKTGEKIKTYIASYFNPILRYTNNDTPWGPLGRRAKLLENNVAKIIRYSDPEDKDPANIAIVTKSIKCDSSVECDATVSLANFIGAVGRSASNPVSLRLGKFPQVKKAVNTTDFGISSEIIKTELSGESSLTASFLINISHDTETCDALIDNVPDLSAIKEDIEKQEKIEQKRLAGLNIEFSNIEDDKVNPVLFNRFIKGMQGQVNLCALGKNYSGWLLGVRDVFQQLTCAQIWNADEARAQIVRSLNFIMSNGRAPRQFSVPASDDIIPTFDIRQFIDQGLWIIETVHKYLSSTGDYSILSEKCSYYDIIDEKKALYKKSDVVDTVLDHLVKITDFLTDKIDDRTSCLRILYGDWNDSICGMGATDRDEEFGTGVSVMASLQLYKLLLEMSEILAEKGGYKEKIKELLEIREKLAEGLCKFALVDDGDKKHILHGWGDMGSYLVGSTCDTDGANRYSATGNSFWCISGLIERTPELKESIMHAYDVLDSKYGIKTVEPYFPEDMKGVGRIVNLLPGTHENSCTYVHCTTFAIMALFIMGEARRAWEQIFKVIPLTHPHVSKTSFVMPNSYCYNEEYELDGESCGDWYTGSGAVLTRCLYEYAIGIQAEIKGVRIATPDYLPTDSLNMSVKIKGADVKYTYKKMGGERRYLVNGIEVPYEVEKLSGVKYIFIPNEQMKGKVTIEVID